MSARPFAVQLQFAPRDCALLRVNKQVFREASNIFYHENVFRFPTPLFVGPPVLKQLDKFYKVPVAKLRMMRDFIIEVPVCNLICESNLEYSYLRTDVWTRL